MHNLHLFRQIKVSRTGDRLDNLQTKGVDTPVTDRMQKHSIGKGIAPSELLIDDVVIMHALIFSVYFLLTESALTVLFGNPPIFHWRQK